MAAAKEGHVNVFRVLVFAGANAKLCNKAGETAIDLSRSKENRDLFEQVMLEFTLERGSAGGFYALHFSARRGDMAAARLLTKRGCDVNAVDGDGYTPLMLAAREGHAEVCQLLIHGGAKCDAKTHRGETALSLARSNAKLGKDAENVILDELAMALVLRGGHVKKHTKCGRGSPHGKVLRMAAEAGCCSGARRAAGTWCAGRQRWAGLSVPEEQEREGRQTRGGAVPGGDRREEGGAFRVWRRGGGGAALGARDQACDEGSIGQRIVLQHCGLVTRCEY
ncbi:unnamed protein product [Musa banksii]